jgi:HAD superfamily hydrolase (TIGR01509 family)
MPAPSHLLFDYGNTLIAFGPAQQEAQRLAMQAVLAAHGIAFDPVALDALRKEQVLRPYGNGGVENDFREVCHEVVARFADAATAERLAPAIMAARQEAFLASVAVDPGVLGVLERLRSRHTLGLLSNYPCTVSIVDSLRKLGLLDLFDAVVVSADVGFAKPHPKTFQTLLARLDAAPASSLYVGDNWLADVQGAKRLGMGAVWVREHVPYETFAAQHGDFEPDGILERFVDLEAWLA